MATVVGTYSSYGTQLVMNVYEESTNYGGNYSGMRIQVYMYQPNNSKPWALDAVNSFSAGLGNGAGWGYSYGYDHRAGNGATTWLVNEVYNYGHNSLGQATVSFSASSSCAVIGSASTGTGYAGTTDFQYPPGQPTAYASRGGDGSSITVSSSAPGSNATITDYNYRWSRDNANWSGNVGMGTGRVATFTTSETTQDFYFQTAAYSSEGWSSWSGSAFVQGVPTVPTSVVGTASSSVSGRITVSWTAPSDTNGGITTYYVYRNGTYVGQTGNANTSYIDDGLTKGTSYTYTVRAYNAIGYSALSSASTATQAPGVPYAATLNSVTPSTDTFGKVTLAWTAPATAVGTIQNYYMYAVFNGVIEKTVTTPSATTSGDITGLDVRKVYTFYVRARNQFSIDNGTPGDQSNTINKKSPGAPTAPTALSSSAPFFPPGTIDLSWTAPSDVGTEGGVITGYNIYLAGSSTPIKTINGTGTTTTVEDLIPATSYTFQIRARNAIADIVGTFSDLSNSTTATAQGEPNAPVGLTVVSDPIVAGRLILTWEPPVGYNTGFRVYTGADVLVANIAVPRLEIDGLTPNTSYSYKVRARNPLTDLTGSPGGPASATVAGVVGASSTQAVPSISVSNTTNNTFVGTHSLISTTATTMSYAKTASNIPFASVPTNGGSTVNNTNTNLNGTYTVTVVGTQATSTELTYPRAGADITANTSTPSGTMYNNTNVVFNGNYEVLAFPAPDPVLKTVSYSKVGTNISSRVASGPITNNSNATYNGEYVVSDVTETTITYPKTNVNIAESDAFGTVYNKTNQDIFNGTFTLTDTPDHKTVEYSTGDLTYGENLITNPSFETVQTGTTILRTNLISNPNFETNVTGWSGTSASIARSSDRSYAGSYSGLVTPGSTSGSVSTSATTVSGQVYTASVWVFAAEATSLRMIVDSPATNGTTVAVTADTWTRLSVSFTADTTTTSIGVQTVGTTQPFYVDAVLLEQTSELRPYFSGATADALGWDYGWTGTANASTSTAKAATSIVSTNLVTNPSMEASSGTVTVRTNLVTNPSMETVTPGSVVMRRNLMYNASMISSTGVMPDGMVAYTSGGSTGTRSTVSGSSSTTISGATLPSTGSVFGHYYPVPSGTLSGLGTTMTASGTVSGLTGTNARATFYVDFADTLGYIGTAKFNTTTNGRFSGAVTLSRTPTGLSAFVWVESLSGSVTGAGATFSDLLIEQGTVAGTFFSGATTDALGWDYAWSGTANASISTAACAATTVRTNLSVDPAATANSAYGSTLKWTPQWFGAGGAGTTSVITGQTGPVSTLTTAIRKTWTTAPTAPNDIAFGFSQIGTNGYPVTAAQSYSASAYYRKSWSDVGSTAFYSRMRWRWYNSAGTLILEIAGSNAVRSVANVWARVSDIQTAPAGAAFLNIVHEYWTDASLVAIGSTFDGTGLLVETSSTVGDYFDGSFTPAGDFSYAWTGTANASTSIARGATVVGTVDPFNNSAGYQSSVWAQSGSRSVRITPMTASVDTFVSPGGDVGALRLGMVAGTTYTVSGTIRLAAAQTGTLAGAARKIVAYTRIGAGGYVPVESTQAVNTAGTTRLSVTFTVPAGATEAFIRLYNGASAGNGDVWWDAVMLEASPIVQDYFDGSVVSADADLTNSWSGTPHASTSLRRGVRVNTTAGNNPYAAAIQSTNWKSTGSSSLRIIPVATQPDSFAAINMPVASTMAGKTYTILAKIRLAAPLTGTLDGRALKFVGMVNLSGGGTEVVFAGVGVNNVAGVQEYRATFTIPATATTWSFARLYNGASAGNGDVWWDDLLVVEGNYTGDYFDGTTADTSIYNYKWSGAAHASTSVVEALAPSPLEFTGISASVLNSYSLSHSGNMSALVTPNGTTCSLTHTATTVAGAIYTYSAWVYATAARTLKLSADSAQGLTISVPATTWTRLSLSFTAEDSSTVLSIIGTDSTQSFYVDDVMLEASSTLSTYFDGDTDANTDTWPVVYTWAGTPHASTSIREVGGTLPSVGAELVLPYGEAARVNSKAQLQIQYRSGWIG